MSKVWYITGSSRGFGRELVRAALDTGDSVVATARRPEQLADLATTYGERILALPLDVTDAAAAAVVDRGCPGTVRAPRRRSQQRGVAQRGAHRDRP